MKNKHLLTPFILLILLATGIYSSCNHVGVQKSMAIPSKPAYSSFQAVYRANSTTTVTLTTAFQKIIWNGTSTLGLNGNTFPLDPAGSGNQLITYNTSTNILNFYNPTTANYTVYFTGTTNATLLTTPVKLWYRVTVPNYFGVGNDLHYPNPEKIGYGTVGIVTTITTDDFELFFPLTVDNLVKTNGAYIEVALSNGTLGTITLTSATLRIAQTNSTL